MAWASANLPLDFLLRIYFTLRTGVYFPGLAAAAVFYYPISIAVTTLAAREKRLTLARMAQAI